jgi:hypothetical protein
MVDENNLAKEEAMVLDGAQRSRQATDPKKAQQNTTQSTVNVSSSIKRRSPLLVILFSILTVGIYLFYWTVSTTNELRRNTQSAPNPWMILAMFIPLIGIVVTIIYWYRYSKAINELTGYNDTILLLFFIIFVPIGVIIAQMELNKKAV